jgi:hypothetical protein
MLLGKTIASLNQPIDFDLGLPAIGLDIDGAIAISLTWDLNLRIGISRDDGFYIDTSDPDELRIALDVTIPGLSASGRLAFLGLDAEDFSASELDPDDPIHTASTHLTGAFVIDLLDPGQDDDRLTFTEVTGGFDLGDIVQARFTAEAVVNLHLTAGFRVEDSAAFPSVKSDFHLDWVFNSADPEGDGLFGNTPNISFRKVRLDVGTFVGKILGPIVYRINQVLEPIRPVLRY